MSLDEASTTLFRAKDNPDAAINQILSKHLSHVHRVMAITHVSRNAAKIALS